MTAIPQELLIISWPTMNRAKNVLTVLQQMDAHHLVHLKYGAVLVKDSHGKLTSTVKKAPVTAGEGAAVGAIVGGVLGIVVQYLTHHGSPPRDLLHTADDLTTTAGAALGAGAGIAAVGTFAQLVPHEVVQSVEHALTPKSSALIAVVHIDDLAPVLASLKAYPDGTIIQSTLPQPIVEQLIAIEAHSP